MCFSYNVDKVTLVDLSHLFYSHTGVKWVILPSQYSDEEYFNQTGNQHYTIVLTFSLFFFLHANDKVLRHTGRECNQHGYIIHLL